LAAKLESEKAARLEFERASEDRERNNRYEASRLTTKDTTPIWKHELSGLYSLPGGSLRPSRFIRAVFLFF